MIHKNKLNDHPIVDHMSDILDEYEYEIHLGTSPEWWNNPNAVKNKVFPEQISLKVKGISKDPSKVKNKIAFLMLDIIYDNMNLSYGFTKDEIINITKMFNEKIDMIKSIRDFENFNLIKVSTNNFIETSVDKFDLNLIFEPIK